jgi:2-methylcitrate dehydratase PrpD
VLSAALALAEARRISGSELVVAYIAGVEVACRLGDAIDPRHYLAGLHPTGTLGVFGAAAACARILKLQPGAIRHVLGIAGTLSSGLRANRGTMAKGMNAGHAAQSGVLAARLAARGFSAAENIFDAPMGFFDALSPGGVEHDLLRFGMPFFFDRPGIAIKLYPCAGVLHPGLDAVLSLRASHKIVPESVQRIRVSLEHRAALPLVYDDPQDPLQAKFSLPFAFAVAVVDGAAGLRQFSAARLHDPKIRRLMRRVELIRQRSGSQKPAGIDTEVEIHTGRAVHRARSSVARGHPSRPATRADLEEKFRQCAARVLPERAIERFLRNFSGLRRSRSMARWLGPLRLPRHR